MILASLTDSILEGIKEILSGIVKLIYDAISWFFSSFYTWAVEKVTALVNTALTKMDIPYDVDWLPEVYSTMNYFFPLNELLAILTVLFFLWVYIFILKIILKAIPTLW